MKVERLRAVGGGANSPAWLQIKADVYGLPVEALSVTEADSLGAALLGRRAKEGIEDFAGLINKLVKVREVYEPNKERNALYEERFEVYKRIYPALKTISGKERNDLKAAFSGSGKMEIRKWKSQVEEGEVLLRVAAVPSAGTDVRIFHHGHSTFSPSDHRS